MALSLEKTKVEKDEAEADSEESVRLVNSLERQVRRRPSRLPSGRPCPSLPVPARL